MMEFTGTIKAIGNSLDASQFYITFTANEKPLVMEHYLKLKNESKLKIKVQKFKEKRSLDANAYAWKLMSEIADAIGTSKEIVYEEMLRRYGANATDEDGALVIISVPAKTSFKNVDIHCAYYDTQYLPDGEELYRYRLIKGSSLYDTVEMSRLIDGIVSECNELGFDTATPDELRQMKERWGV